MQSCLNSELLFFRGARLAVVRLCQVLCVARARSVGVQQTTPPCARRGPCPIYVRDAWIAPGSEHLKQLSLVCTAILKRQAEALTSLPPGKSSMCEKKKTSKSSGSCSACVNTHATAFRCGPPPSAEFSRPSPKLGRRRSLNPPAHWPMVP